MDNDTGRAMPPFDEWTIPSKLHRLKLLLPYLPPDRRQMLGMFIRFQEFSHTMAFFDQTPRPLHSQHIPEPTDFHEIIENISPFLSPKERENLDTFWSMLNILEMMQMQTGTEEGENR